MPIKEFAGDCTVLLRESGQGDITFALPVVDGRVKAVPKRPKGPGHVTLVNGLRKERRPEGWYLDVELQWEELSVEAHEALFDCVDALAQRTAAQSVFFSPVSPADPGMEWEVVPSIEEGTIDVVYEKRVQGRPAQLILPARSHVTALPSWMR